MRITVWPLLVLDKHTQLRWEDDQAVCLFIEEKQMIRHDLFILLINALSSIYMHLEGKVIRISTKIIELNVVFSWAEQYSSALR